LQKKGQEKRNKAQFFDQAAGNFLKIPRVQVRITAVNRSELFLNRRNWHWMMLFGHCVYFRKGEK
jgi:hypothetical protein